MARPRGHGSVDVGGRWQRGGSTTVVMFVGSPQFFSVSLGGCGHDKLEGGGTCPGNIGAITRDLQYLTLVCRRTGPPHYRLDFWDRLFLLLPPIELAKLYPPELGASLLVRIGIGLVANVTLGSSSAGLNGDFDVKISDFGLAKLIDRDQSQVLTVLKGTPGYVAPELYTGINISVKADVFSFGIVVLEIVFGRKNLGSSQFEPLIVIVKEKAEKDLYLLGVVHSRRPSMSSMVKVLEGSMDLESIAEYCFLSMPEIATHIQANSAASANSTPPADSSLSGPR
ncbi:hypothetical protein RJ640_004325 [Escallonia rubra]|uniref:Protein kinase domain-containing protein n=1 Tax=Escallonia rubra TaxID=112253 RepID=A0AA88R9U2_9ASTE|nr:hypothetical protein RJ640_004325 [Escallonia rubra]